MLQGAWPKALLAATSAALLLFCFPLRDMGWLIWLAPAPLFILVLHGRGRIGGWAYLCGLLWFLPLLGWMQGFSELGWALAAAFCALFVAAFALAAHHLTRRLPAFWAPLVLASAWTVAEWLRCAGPLRFSWGQLAVSQYRYPTVLQMLDWTGSFGLTWLIALVAASVAALFSARTYVAGGRWLFVSLWLLGLLSMRGHWVLQRAAQDRTPVTRVAVVQASGSSYRGISVRIDSPWARYAQLTRREATREAQLVIWPETAVVEDLVHDEEARQRTGALAAEIGADLLSGSFVHDADAPKPANSAVLFGRDGVVRGRYDKVNLVPFGEYLPLRSVTERFVPDDAIPYDLTAGKVFEPIPWRKGKVGVVICFESAFPGPTRRLTREGSNLLAIITSDTWPGKQAAGRQHLAFAPLRAVESRRSMARAAATGVSALIDPYGRVLDRLEADERGSLSNRLPLRQDRTFYVIVGDWPVGLSVLLLLAALAAVLLRGDVRGDVRERPRRRQAPSPKRARSSS